MQSNARQCSMERLEQAGHRPSFPLSAAAQTKGNTVGKNPGELIFKTQRDNLKKTSQKETRTSRLQVRRQGAGSTMRWTTEWNLQFSTFQLRVVSLVLYSTGTAPLRQKGGLDILQVKDCAENNLGYVYEGTAVLQTGRYEDIALNLSNLLRRQRA